MVKKVKFKEKVSKTTVLNGFHMVYPSNHMFERYIDNGRAEIVQLYHLLPESPCGGYESAKYTVTIEVEPIPYERTAKAFRRLNNK